MKTRTIRRFIQPCLIALLVCAGPACGAEQLKPVMDITISTGFFVSDKSIPLRFYSYEEEPYENGKRIYIKSIYNFTGSGAIISNELSNAQTYKQLAKESQDHISGTVLELRRTRRPLEVFRSEIHDTSVSILAFLGTTDGGPQLFSKLSILDGKKTYIDLYTGGFVESCGAFSENGKRYLFLNIIFCGASACSSELKIYALPPS